MSCTPLPTDWAKEVPFTVAILIVSMICGTHISAAELELRIDNPPTNRTVIALLFDSADTFVDLRDPVRVVTHSPEDSVPLRIMGLPGGQYALVVYQDDNSNERLDKNFIGIPREPLGFSNRYWPQGPPTFTGAAFRLEEGESRSFDIQLQSVFGKWGYWEWVLESSRRPARTAAQKN